MTSFLRRKVLEPVLTLLKQGITPEKLALSFACGVVIAAIPILGVTTFLCIVVASTFRLNHVAIQLANYLAYPIQFALLIPFFRMGERLFGLPPAPFHIPSLIQEFQQDFMRALSLYGMTGLRGAIAWSLTAPLAATLLYFVFLPIIRGISKKLEKAN